MIALDEVAADPVAQLVSTVAILCVLIIVGVISELTRRRARKVDSTVGEPPTQGADQSTVAEHVASTDAKLDLAIEQLGTMRDLVAANGQLMTQRLDHIDTVMAERGRVLADQKDSLRDHGERIGALEQDVAALKATPPCRAPLSSSIPASGG
jgi:hypothetical protein